MAGAMQAAAGQCLARREVALIADEHDGHVGVGVLPRVFQPARQVVERLAPSVQAVSSGLIDFTYAYT